MRPGSLHWSSCLRSEYEKSMKNLQMQRRLSETSCDTFYVEVCFLKFSVIFERENKEKKLHVWFIHGFFKSVNREVKSKNKNKPLVGKITWITNRSFRPDKMEHWNTVVCDWDGKVTLANNMELGEGAEQKRTGRRSKFDIKSFLYSKRRPLSQNICRSLTFPAEILHYYF